MRLIKIYNPRSFVFWFKFNQTFATMYEWKLASRSMENRIRVLNWKIWRKISVWVGDSTRAHACNRLLQRLWTKGKFSRNETMRNVNKKKKKMDKWYWIRGERKEIDRVPLFCHCILLNKKMSRSFLILNVYFWIFLFSKIIVYWITKKSEDYNIRKHITIIYLTNVDRISSFLDFLELNKYIVRSSF